MKHKNLPNTVVWDQASECWRIIWTGELRPENWSYRDHAERELERLLAKQRLVLASSERVPPPPKEVHPSSEGAAQ